MHRLTGKWSESADFSHDRSVSHGCASHVQKSEAAGSLIAPLWLAAVQVKPRPLHVNEWDFRQNKK